MNWIIFQKDDGYELLKITRKPCAFTGQIKRLNEKDFQGVDEGGCKNECDADENCTYLFYRSQNQKCILCSSYDTQADYQPKKGKLFKKKLDWNQSTWNRYSTSIWIYIIGTYTWNNL